MKAKVIIIEDNYNHYTGIKGHISALFDVYPVFENEDSFNFFKGFLAASFNGGNTEKEERRRILEQIESDLSIQSLNRDLTDIVFIVDFQLKADNKDFGINGWKFYEAFLKVHEIPTLFISQETDLNYLKDNINYEIIANKRMENYLLDFIKKEKSWMTSLEFGTALKEKLKNLLDNKKR